MVKNLLQDVVPAPRRSIRNVAVPSYRKKEEVKAPVSTPPPPPKELSVRARKILKEPEFENVNIPEVKKGGKKKILIFAFLFIIIVGIVFVWGTFFASATVSITPRQQKIVLDEVLRAGDATNGMNYEVVTLSRTEGKVVPATENETVEDRASGKIIIYNNYNGVQQRLVKNTRFETPEGLIFRIRDSVNVPGQTVKDGQTIPGSVEAVVYADTPGEKYNIPLTDFTIPGFKGDPKYKTFYARSVSPMTGGFVGVRKKVSEAVKNAALKEVQDGLVVSLSQEVKAQIPQNFTLFDDSLFYEFEDAPQTEVKADSVKVNVKGTVRAAIFDTTKLQNFIAGVAAPALSNTDVEFTGLSSVVAAVKNKSAVDIKNHGVFEISLKGEGIVAAVFPADKILSELVGKNKGSLSEVLSHYLSIQEAEAHFSPFWKMTFPTNPKYISVVRVLQSK